MDVFKRLFGKKDSSEPGQHPGIDAYRIDGDGNMRQTSVEAIMDREKLREEHERGVEVMDRGNYGEALAIFKRVLNACGDDPDPMNYLNIAVCHAHLGEFKQSLAVLEEAMRRWPDNSRLRQNYEAIKRDAR